MTTTVKTKRLCILVHAVYCARENVELDFDFGSAKFLLSAFERSLTRICTTPEIYFQYNVLMCEDAILGVRLTLLHGTKSAGGASAVSARNVTNWVDVNFGAPTSMIGRKGAAIRDALAVVSVKTVHYVEVGVTNIL